MPEHEVVVDSEVKPKVRKSRRWFWVASLAVVVAAGVFWFARTRSAYSQAPKTATPAGGAETGVDAKKGASKSGRQRGAAGEVPVAAGKARRGDMPVFLDGLGSVNAFYTVTVRSRVDGELMTVAYKEGDYVQKGQLLAQIDPRPYQVQLLQAQGQLARDQALLENARLDLKRYQTLIAQDAIPQQQLDTQKSTVGQYEGTVKQDQGLVDNATLQLTYSRITAPITGRIGLRLVDPGNIVHATDTNGLLVITQLQPIAVLFTIPEDNLPSVLKKLRAGANLQVDAYNRDKSRKLARGRLLTNDNQIDPQTGTSRLKAVFENRDNTLFPNQFVNVRLLVDTQRNQVIIPAVAVQRGQQGTYLYVIKPDNSVEVRTVQVGLSEGTDVAVTSGVQAGETVVTDGTDRLQAGTKVRIRPPATSTNASST